MASRRHDEGRTYINNTTESTDGVGPVYSIGAAASILHNGTRNHDNILGGVGQLLDNKVNHLSQARIFILKELGYAEEAGGGFVGRELLAGI